MLKLVLILQIMNYHCEKEESRKVNGLMKDELGRKIMTKLIGLRTKTLSYLIDYGGEDKKAKGTEMCHKRKT